SNPPPPVLALDSRGPHEDDFFARGDGSFPPSSVDTFETEVDEAVLRRRSPHVVERRARMQRIVTGVVGVAAVLSLAVGAKALFSRSAPLAADTSLSVSRPTVASIALALEEPAPSAAPPPANANTALTDSPASLQGATGTPSTPTGGGTTAPAAPSMNTAT